MNISAELAAKVLDADLRNEIKKVSDGGTLSPSVRALLHARVLPDGSAKSCRVANLVTKYAAGARLTAGELEEVREVHPEFAPDEPAAPVESPAEQSSVAPLKLTPEPSPALGDGEITRAQLDTWSVLYDTENRQIRRWIARGKERGDPCPLDNPIAMPAWIEKHLDKIRGTLREKVNAAAEAARAKEPQAAPTKAEPDATPSAAPTKTVVSATIAPLDLASVGGVEGESVELFRRLFSATKMQLEEAYAKGQEERIRSLTTRIEKTGEALRKHESAAEQRARKRGELLEKAEVFNEVTQALNTLALLRDQRKKRVRAELHGLPPELLDRIDASIDRVGLAEEAVLRNLSTLRTTADVLFALAA